MPYISSLHLSHGFRIVFTGEGRFDASSFQGKGSGDLVRRAVAYGKKVVVFAGSVEENLPVPQGVEVVAISPAHLPLREALARGGEFLSLAVKQIVRRLEKDSGAQKNPAC